MGLAKKLWIPATVLSLVFGVYTYFETDISTRLGVNPGAIPIFSVLALLSVIVLLNKGASGWAFVMTAISIAFSTITIFMGPFPRVLVSSTNPDWSLTIYNASSSQYTLGIMTTVAAIFVPIVLLYQGWSYWVFRQRISKDSKMEY